MLSDETAFAPANELARLIATKQISPVELVELYLRRIDRLDGTLHSFLTVAVDQAIASAKEAEGAVLRGEDLGPLHGVPISIKDLDPTRGIRTTGGSLVFKDRVPESDSIVVERVRGLGAIILGIGLWEAWKFNRRVEVKFTGPFAVTAAQPSPTA